MIRSRFAALLFRCGSFILIFAGLAVETNLFGGGLNPNIFFYYTIQSNLLALVLFAMLIFRTAKGWALDGVRGKTGYFARFEMVCAIDLLLTLAVFWALLAPSITSSNSRFSLWSFANLSVHLIAPLLCLIDYILFSEARHLKYSDIYAVLIFPLAYLAFSSLAGLMGHAYGVSAVDGNPVRFPYFFLDFDRTGAMPLVYIGALTVFFLIIAHVFYIIDNKLRRVEISVKKNI